MSLRTIGIVCLTLCASACGKSEPAAAPAPTPAAPAAPSPSAQPSTTAAAPTVSSDPKEVFKTRCVMCHGESGHGDGPASAALNPKPRNYTDKEWQKTISDEQIKATIT